jgi:hypothetical protein
MTANELADILQYGDGTGYLHCSNIKTSVTYAAALMLQQQAKEIEDLKTFITVNRMQILDALDNVDAILKRARNTDV